jgi:hypothetical protein
MPQLRYNQQANPQTKLVVNAIYVVPTDYSWATFVNTGLVDATIDFGNGQTIPLGPKESISMPYINRAYAPTTVDATGGGGTTVKVVYLP